MKNRLSQLVGLRNDIEATFDNEISLRESTFHSVELWKKLWRRHDSELYKVTKEIKNLVKEMLEIERQFDQLKYSRKESIINDLQIEINQEVSYLIDNQSYKENFCKVIPVKSMIEYDTETYNKIKIRISETIDWQYPGLEIGSLHKELTKVLTSCDPLYIFDETNEYSPSDVSYSMPIQRSSRLEDNISQFNKLYQRRLRKYVNLDKLPQRQFGFVFSWEFFNYLNKDITKQYLTQVYGLMRDGGHLIFGYNNCNNVSGARAAEGFEQSWNTEQDLVSFLKELGFINIKGYTIDNDHILHSQVSWIEAIRPGVLKTVKAHPVSPSVHKR